MRIGFRVDANTFIGTGHVHRCMNLAREMLARGHEITFLVGSNFNLNEILQVGSGINIRHISDCITSFSTGDETPKTPLTEVINDARCSRDLVLELGLELVVLDHYSMTNDWLDVVKHESNCKVVVVDDVGRSWGSADYILDSSIGAAGRYHSASLGCITMFGPAYVPLNPRYRGFVAEHKQAKDKLELVVFFGGVDAPNATRRALAELVGVATNRLSVTVVIGEHNVHKEGLRREFEPHGFSFVEPADSMFDYLMNSDMSLGAGGTTTWERLCLGVPSIVIGIAANQVSMTRELEALGCLQYLGRLEELAHGDIRMSVGSLLEDKWSREVLSVKGRTLVDGFGSSRICETIDPSSQEEFVLRESQVDDCLTLFRWVNEPEVRRSSLNSAEVSWVDHQSWFESTSVNPEKVILMAEVRDMPIAQIRFERLEEQIRLSYSVDPTQRGKGVGHWIVSQGVLWIRQRWHSPIVAEVRAENLASRRIFETLNFRQGTSLKPDVLTFVLDVY
jgi:UDP-2,4-diacetamido-2,4,6-trideoxy-beta-L-altropyranose hydrolase